MTRREFRAEVDTPRPAAAWWMSLVASASLWLTEQLPVWVVANQWMQVPDGPSSSPTA